ncbi:MAG: NAD(+) synthase [Flavobacteriales bacterium]|tara:strand:+ start:11588 stop:12385 length:798 start_codon:yes stop_codon:yes gene_type:complete
MKTEKVSELIVSWLKSYAQKNKISGFVVGVSGGIDSAVTSTLCAKTGLKVLCLEMPIKQNDEHVSRAKNHIQNLELKYKNVSSELIDLNSVFISFCNEVNSENHSLKNELALANTRARLRMTTLYYYAGTNNYLVVGTGNKVEDFGVGFYTKYGDGGVDLSPIADLLKSEVVELGIYLEISELIIKAKPSDGLYADSRSDEDQLGATYDELEWAMRVEDHNTKTENEFSSREKKVLEIYRSLNSKNKHKMVPIPICKIPEDLLKN